MLWCYTEGVITVKVSVRTSIIDNKPSILLHLVGFLSSRYISYVCLSDSRGDTSRTLDNHLVCNPFVSGTNLVPLQIVLRNDTIDKLHVVQCGTLNRKTCTGHTQKNCAVSKVNKNLFPTLQGHNVHR